MKVSEFITQGQRQIKDAVGTKRWGDEVWCLYLSNALRRLWGTHPEAFYVSAVVTDAPAEITSASTSSVIPVLDDYLGTLLHEVCAWILIEDREGAANIAASDSHYQKAIAEA